MTMGETTKDKSKRAKLTKSVLLYLFFVFISVIFWCFITLNKTTQQDITFRIEITDIPNKVTFITDPPAAINVNIRDKGVSLLRYMLGDPPVLRLKFSEFSDSSTCRFAVNAVQMRNLLKRVISRDATVVGVTPESINVEYTKLSKKVPIRLDANVRADIRYVIMGYPELSQDSVTVYGNATTLGEISEVYTYHVEERDVTDTLRRDVTIAPIVGVKIVPRTVHMTVPVEQLILKKKKVPISLRNTPSDVKLVIFPSAVEVSYLVPKSLFKVNRNDITVIVDYNSINLHSTSNKVAVRVGEAPAVYRNVELDTDSVEYIIER